MAQEFPDQISWSNHDLGIEKGDEGKAATQPPPSGSPVVQRSETVVPSTPETSLEDMEYFDPAVVFEIAKNQEVSDPVVVPGQKQERIGLVTLYEREFKDSWYAMLRDPERRDNLESITVITKDIFKKPDAIRALAKAFRSTYLDEVQEQINEASAGYDALEPRVDRAADVERRKLSTKLEELHKKWSLRKLIGNEISAYLATLANEWERRPKKKLE